MQRAVPATGRKITALGVEQCRCPQEYSGLSCQVTTGFSSATFFIENNIFTKILASNSSNLVFQNFTMLFLKDPAAGNYRGRPEDIIDTNDVLDLIGESVPCKCHGHSTTCDKETGICSVNIVVFVADVSHLCCLVILDFI